MPECSASTHETIVLYEFVGTQTKSKRPQHPTWCVVSSYHCSRGHCLRILGSSKGGSAKKDDSSIMSYHLIYLLLPITCTCKACLSGRVRRCCIKSKVVKEYQDTMNKPTNNKLEEHCRMECRGNWKSFEPNQTITEDQYGQLCHHDHCTIQYHFQKQIQQTRRNNVVNESNRRSIRSV